MYRFRVRNKRTMETAGSEQDASSSFTRHTDGTRHTSMCNVTSEANSHIFTVNIFSASCTFKVLYYFMHIAFEFKYW
jgi:hypothetical protein